MRPARRRKRRPGDLEVFGAVGIRADQQRRSAIKTGMALDFVLNTGSAKTGAE